MFQNDELLNSEVLHPSEKTPEPLRKQYRYIRLLGEGASGKTWLAENLSNSENVAVKELKDIEGFKQQELFVREAETLKSINTPGVPKFYDSFLGDKECYLVEEFIPYPSLQEMINSGKQFTEREVLDILESVASILNSLQNQYVPPIIHRDIKPSNILINIQPNGRINTYLIDFGSVIHPEKQHKEGSTIAGTFGYMPPEQLQGQACIQSDYYALGVTALHLLTGVSPVDIETKVFKLIYEPVLQQKAPNTSKNMKDLLNLLLAVKIEDRPQNVNELLNAIHHRALSKKR